MPFLVEFVAVLDLVASAFRKRGVAPNDDALLLVSLVVINPHVLARYSYRFVVRYSRLGALRKQESWSFPRFLKVSKAADTALPRFLKGFEGGRTQFLCVVFL